MKTIVCLNNKGGVGKTATVTAVAHMLATVYEKKVLVVDMDPQGNTSNLFGTMDFVTLIKARIGHIDLGNIGQYSVGDLLVDAALDPGKVIKNTAYERLDLIPSYPTLAAIEETLKADIKRPQQFRLSGQLEKIAGDYDYCLIDCGPSLSILNVNALVAADEVYIPTLPDDGSLFGIELTVSELVWEIQKYSMRLQVGGIFFTRYRANYNVSKYARELLEQVYTDMFLPFTISESVAVAESSHRHMPLLAYDQSRHAKATRDYLELAGYIASENRKGYLKECQSRREAG